MTYEIKCRVNIDDVNLNTLHVVSSLIVLYVIIEMFGKSITRFGG